MQKKPRKSKENNFMTLLNFIADPAVIVDEKGIFLVVNDAFTDLTGLSKNELIGTSFLNVKILAAESKTSLLKNLKKRMQGLSVEPYEISLTDETGKARYVEVKAKKIDYAGWLADLVIFHDITRRKENARRLKEYSEKMEALVNEKVKEVKESEERYRELTESISDIFFAMDKDLKYTYWNKASEKLTGISAKDAIGKHLTEIFPNVKGTKVEQFYKEVLRTKQPQSIVNKYRFRDKDFVFEISAYPTMDGLSVFVKDITEHKKAEETLKESEEKFRNLAEKSPNMIFINQKGRVVYANKKCEEVMGYRREEFYSPDFDFFTLIAPEYIDLLKSSFSKHMKGEEVAPLEYALIAKEGKRIEAILTTKLIAFKGETAILGIVTDITERKKAEEALRVSEKYSEGILNSVLTGVVIIDEKTHQIVDANLNALETIGASREHVIGKVCHRFICPAEKGKCPISDLGQTVDRSERVLLKANGERIPILKTVTMATWRGQKYLIESFIDISERKWMEEQLRESEEKYRKQFEEALDAMFVADAETGILIDCNRAASELVRREKSELVGKHQRILHLPEEIEGKFSRTFKQHLKEKEGQILEAQVITKRGKIKDVAIKASVFELRGKKLMQGIFRDITEQKKAEAALRESEEKYRELINGMNDTAWVIDLDGNFIDVNDAAAKVLGYSREELLRMGPPDIDNSLTKEQIKNLIRSMPADQIQVFETVHTTKDGKTIPVEISSSLVTYQEKQAILSIARDITQRKQIEMKLQEAEKRYRTLFNQAPLGILLIDQTATAVEFNEEAHRQLGYSREEFAKLIVSDYEVLETPAETRARMKKILKTGRDEFETIHRTKTGEIRDVINTVQVIELAGKKFFHIITRDITEQKKIENELEMEREKLEAVTENIGAGLGIISEDYRILWANKLLKQLYGDCEGKICYSTFNRLTGICPDCGVKKVFENGVPIDVHEYITKDDKGNTVWVELIVTPIKDEKGNVIAALELAVNITERKIMQNKLAKYSQKLEKLVEKRTEQLKRTQAKLVKSERLATIGELAAMIGHDLRNPLTGIMGAAYYLKAKHGTEVGAKSKEMLEIIEKAIIRSNKIINDLLEYSRDLKLEFTATTPKAMLQSALSLLKVPEKIQIVDATVAKPMVKADTEKIRKVFVNIIQNAIDAMPEGGTLTIRSRKVEGKLVIAFQDTGVGMSEETLSKLEGGVPLFTTKAKGMGFGLPICKRLAEVHGGKICVESAAGKGTTITVTIPVNPEPIDEGEEKWILSESMLSAITSTQREP